MKLNKLMLAAAALLVVPSFAAFAGDAAPAATTPAATTPAPAAAPVAAPAAPAAPAAAPAAPAAKTPPPVPAALKEWTKFCDPAPDGKNHTICIVRRLVFNGTNIVGTLSLRLDSAKGVPTLAVAAVPVGVVLKPGLKWQIDNSKALSVPYWRCTPQTCESELLANDSFINGLKQGHELKLTAKTVDGKDFVNTISLTGFTATYDKKDAPTFAEFNASLSK